jgi:hypothetical protein
MSHLQDTIQNRVRSVSVRSENRPVKTVYCYCILMNVSSSIRFFVLRLHFLSTRELHLDLVFCFGIGRYFPGILPTDTGGKLGWYVLVSYIWREPLFPLLLPPICGPSKGNSHKISHNGAPAKSYSTKNTIHTIPNIVWSGQQK